MRSLPLNDSLWAIKKTLDHYNISNSAIHLTDKSQLKDVPVPFLAQVTGDFCIVSSTSEHDIRYTTAFKRVNTGIEQFVKEWSGIVVLCKATNETTEPDYSSNRRLQKIDRITKLLTWVSCAVVLVCTFLWNNSFSIASVTTIVLSAIGTALSYLLVKKHLHVPSNVTEKLCNIVGHGKCDENPNPAGNDIRLFGMFELSEAGVSFFGVNMLATLLFQDASLPSIALCIAIAVLFSFWSVAWQRIRLKGWCTLCLLVMTTIWVQFATFIFAGIYPAIEPSFAIIAALAALGASYWIALVSVRATSRLYQRHQDQLASINNMQRMKYDRETWDNLLACSEPQLIVTGETASALTFGDLDSEFPLITIVGNPFCNPCAHMHRRLQPLLDAGFCIQYVFTYFNQDLAPVNKQIVAAYISRGAAQTWQLLTQWYDGDRKHHIFNPTSNEPIPAEHEQQIIHELMKHDKWRETSGITATPTVLVDGRPLPSHYQVEDLLYVY